MQMVMTMTMVHRTTDQMKSTWQEMYVSMFICM